MFRLYHGTTYKGAKDIPKNGFQYGYNKAWNCSQHKMVYFYDPKRFDEDDNPNQEAHRWANDNARIQNAMLEKPYNATYVLEFQFQDDDLYKEFENDDSCKNMYEACKMHQYEINKLIKEDKCKIIVHKHKFNVKLAMVYLAGVSSSNCFILENLDSDERVFLEELSKAEVYLDDYF